jgi:Kae1-associated kinase Bud32
MKVPYTKKKIIAQGAEAIIEVKGSNILKKRIKKSYRIPQLDEKLRKLRTRQESRLLEKAALVTNVPKLIGVNEEAKTITLEYLKGQRLSRHLDKMKNRQKVAKQIGTALAQLHDNNIIHGDPTTSNMIYYKNKVYMIDFGLGFQSTRLEDRAVDVHLLKEALEAKHPKSYALCIKAIMVGYRSSPKAKMVLKHLEKVERRGRYKEQY